MRCPQKRTGVVATVVFLLPLTGQAQRRRLPACGVRDGAPCVSPTLEQRFTTVSAGQAHTCAIARGGSVFCWGDSANGESGAISDSANRYPTALSGNFRFTDVRAGGAFTCGITTDNAVACWGKSQVVPGWPAAKPEPALVNGAPPVLSLVVGLRHACVLARDGRALCWGWNVDGEAGIGIAGLERPLVSDPTEVIGSHRFSALSAGSGFTCGLENGAVWCWGGNRDVLGAAADAWCGDVQPVRCATRPVRILLPFVVTAISAGHDHACVVAEAGTVHCWGTNSSGQLGVYARASGGSTPRVVEFPDGERPRAVGSGGLQSCAITTSQRLVCWGADMVNMGGQVVRPDDYNPRVVSREQRFTAVSVGRSHRCALDASGQVFCWGDTVFGAMGPP